VFRVLHIAILLLLLLATGASRSAEAEVCHGSITASASEGVLQSSAVLATSSAGAAIWADATTVSSGHCLPEFVASAAYVALQPSDVGTFDVAEVPYGHGLVVSPEPQPPRN
jgi:hypothetical protein